MFLTSVPLLGSSSNCSVVQMSSLTGIVLYGLDEAQKMEPVYSFDLNSEPSLIVMGPGHMCVVFNNLVQFYYIQEFLGSPEVKPLPLVIKQYCSNVSDVRLNSVFAATLSGDQITLHCVRYKYISISSGIVFFLCSY